MTASAAPRSSRVLLTHGTPIAPRLSSPGSARWPLDGEALRAVMQAQGVTDEALTARLRLAGFRALEILRVLRLETESLSVEWIVRLAQALDVPPSRLILTPEAYYARRAGGGQ